MCHQAGRCIFTLIDIVERRGPVDGGSARLNAHVKLSGGAHAKCKWLSDIGNRRARERERETRQWAGEKVSDLGIFLNAIRAY